SCAKGKQVGGFRRSEDGRMILAEGIHATSHRTNYHLNWTKMSDALVINDIYLSLQGESTLAGLPCVFVRLTACDLRCSYCDTAYAFTEGKKKALPDVLAGVKKLAAPFDHGKSNGKKPNLPLVELT